VDASTDPAARRVAHRLLAWKDEDGTVEELDRSIERLIGHSWSERDADHARVYGLWSDFRERAILPIGGMTMNERLHWFGLSDVFDACEDDAARARIYHKLLARP
jgi:hypothetical protein